jgi:hypothetical protein
MISLVIASDGPGCRGPGSNVEFLARVVATPGRVGNTNEMGEIGPGHDPVHRVTAFGECG